MRVTAPVTGRRTSAPATGPAATASPTGPRSPPHVLRHAAARGARARQAAVPDAIRANPSELAPESDGNPDRFACGDPRARSSSPELLQVAPGNRGYPAAV